jgi:hypothetical protein
VVSKVPSMSHKTKRCAMQPCCRNAARPARRLPGVSQSGVA